MREFEVTEDHIKLLREAYVDWDGGEFGAPAIDCKRPYGNSDVVGDLAEILERESELYPSDSEDRDEEVASELTEIHRETLTALQIFLVTGTMEPGTYQNQSKYGKEWVKVS